MSERKVIYIKEEGVLAVAVISPNGAKAVWYDMFIRSHRFLEPDEYTIFDDLEHNIDD